MQHYLYTVLLMVIIFVTVSVIAFLSKVIADYANKWFGRKTCMAIQYIVYVTLLSLVVSFFINFN